MCIWISSRLCLGSRQRHARRRAAGRSRRPSVSRAAVLAGTHRDGGDAAVSTGRRPTSVSQHLAPRPGFRRESSASRCPKALRFASLVLKGQGAASGLVEDIDYRGVTALGVIRAVPGTDWFIEAKIDRAEAYRAAASSALWIGFAGLLALFAAGGGLFLFRQRQELATGQREHALQAERLRALSLLDAVATSSDDAIFAKDLDGRYLLFNRAAEALREKPRRTCWAGTTISCFRPNRLQC